MPPLLSLGWRGAEVAQLLDAGHASIVNRVVRVLLSSGWQPIVEFTFSHYGERGSVDILAWHAPTQTLLLIEVKTRIVDLQDLVGTMDRKLRVVPHLVEADREWRPKHTGSLLVLPSNSATRAVVERHSAIFDATLPARTVAVRRWVAAPSGDLRGIWFLQNSRTEGSE